MATTAAEPTTNVLTQSPREMTFNTFRRWGFLQASLDPLGQYLPPVAFPLEVPDNDDSREARSYYCGTIAVEFMHLLNREQREWIQQQMEQRPPAQDQARILTQLIHADLFEQVIQSRYLGTKRFSLEGLTVLIPFLDRVFAVAGDLGVERAMIAMAHRGRLNVMVNTIGRKPSEIFTRFEDVDPRSTMGGGDVKYHVGATGEYHSPSGKLLSLHLASNPSHLEAIDPVILGRTRARQIRIGAEGKRAILPLIIHGDAAFAGQGIVAETLNMATLHGYNVGGTVHVITNNLLGFTALPEESNSTRFSTDIAKRLPIPIFHVNAEDPDAVVRVAAIAAEYRQRFQSDIVVDLIGYRRHGHSEVDDPTVTQPRRYAVIKDHPPLYQIYAKRIGVDPAAEVEQVQQELFSDQKAATKAGKKTRLAQLPSYWDNYYGGELKPADENITTGLSAGDIHELAVGITSYPETFHIHPKVKKLLEQRLEMGTGKRPFDYGTAEQIAFASLLEAGIPIRLTGQDSQRGTFNQRHSVMIDTETEEKFIPLQNLSATQGRYRVYNSLLSEAGVLGFEYGFSRDYPEALVLWEAQFGDFANGAQIIIDQFIAASEAKWNLLSGLVMLLPHGFEGQGPEHSSARIERYLQLAASDNMQICQPSTAAQYFHLLRRQALRRWRKPLIVFTPKSMLRHPDASSSVADFALPQFQNVLADTSVENARRILVCTGKIGHNLRVERAKRKANDVAIIFVEQLYPWPEAELEAALDQHPTAEEIVWVQEEPANMGAHTYVMPLLRRVAGDRAVLSVKRSANATPATGSAKAHEIEEKTLIDLAFGAPE
ncbi:2-oxoglutarate dehydrogenase E1 component [Edaphobacter acidisoli]|uniref:oxoglutarate dehydrogenase (succinyl-transferring) n=1 Tax=Edaphobacter acidisoli TaxID=2040573 RepID=A0A916RDZ9_9BACT|nr:2-oxoglutarate dehydrogenase E1 component [Edaphobacter acidisoli]GGA53547.1 2-oxoglutarate dehydrogenase E1 component [Edaphobacter acidisoli]